MPKQKLLDQINEQIWDENLSLSEVVNMLEGYLEKLDDTVLTQILEESKRLERNS